MKSRLVTAVTISLLAGWADAAGLQYSVETFQVPGASITTAIDINNQGQIVGIAQGLSQNVGFLKSGDTFSLISVPEAGPLNGTAASGINDSATIVGTFSTENPTVISHGFLLAGQTLTTFDVPAAGTTQVGDINNNGQIVGRFFPAQGTQIGRGFLKNGHDYTVFDAPGAQDPFGTYPLGMNDHDQIVGQFLDSSGFHSFLMQGNSFSVINVPGSGDTDVNGINNLGQLAGSFRDVSGRHGFVTDGGRFFRLDVPDATGILGTTVFGINDLGQLVGRIDVDNVPGVSFLGFVATPCATTDPNCITLVEVVPEPSSLATLLIGAAGLLMVHLTRRSEPH